MHEQRDKLISVFRSVFPKLDEDSSPEDWSMSGIREWDSLTHMNLMLALREEFAIRSFMPEDFIKLTSFDAILSYLPDTSK
jgi:acyl carrier protein